MPAILGVRVDDQFIELSSPELDSFGKLFDIDSINLLLGKNGSGKTRFLVALARAITPSTDEGARIYFSKEEKKPFSYRTLKEKSCAIYYSALPYRRKLKRRSGLIDASPTARNKNDAGRLLRIGEVARDLGIDTKLTAYFGYSRNVYRSILIPRLHQETEIIEKDLKKLIHTYYKDTDSKELTSNRSTRFIDHEKEEILHEIEQLLDREIDSKLGTYERILFLTSLEYMHGRTREFDAPKAATAFLDYIGLIRANSSKSNFEDLEHIVERTRSALNNYAHPEDFYLDERTQYFQIDSVPGLEAIRRHETPIKIEWSNLSSGLQALVEQFSLIDEAVAQASQQGRSSVLLLIDEGDAYLHLDWQRKYISLLNKYLANVKKRHRLESLQLILATHSPLLAADIPSEFVTNLDSATRTKSFAAPLEEVIAGSFESNSIGEFAASKINEVYKRAQKSKLTKEDRKLISAIGDPAIQAALSGATKA
ncbi:AAA family ATPase [Pseudomonas aeruginosa]|uniref:AAA family ATPase n=1 Tax=Pseudomonas aeruginosa TaxID=287 RepID=UPI0009A44994|nr:AAA family ATPase [Pseudomonas aeruginosa]